MASLLAQVDSLGRFFTKNIEYTFRVLLLVYLSLKATISNRSQSFRQILGVVLHQIYFTGVQALPIITVLSLGIGGLLIIQSLSNLAMLGNSQIIGNFLIVTVIREAGPLMVALVVIARSGTAVASEIGNMRANREIEALETMGINPLSYIVFPRVAGGIISTVALSFYFNVISLMGGYFITSLFHDLPFAFYVASLFEALSPDDLLIFFVKNIFSGMIIFVVSCYQGFSVKRSPHEVPQSTTAAVVNSIIYVVLFNLIVSILFYLNQLRSLGVVQ